VPPIQALDVIIEIYNLGDSLAQCSCKPVDSNEALSSQRQAPGDVEGVNVVYVGHGGRLPARVRVLIDFLAKKEVNLDDALELPDTV